MRLLGRLLIFQIRTGDALIRACALIRSIKVNIVKLHTKEKVQLYCGQGNILVKFLIN